MKKKLPDNNLFFGLRQKITPEQEDFADAIYSDNFDIVFCNAAAGTGKTTIAVAAAKLLVGEKRKDGLVYVFSPVEESKMGFRPGDQYEKELEYTAPLRDALIEIGEQPDKAIVNPNNITELKKKTGCVWVETASHTFKRGTNLKNKVVIIDEAQNFTKEQLQKMLTRCHDSCKVVVIGHSGQCDLPNPNLSGFERYIEWFREPERAKICTLTKNFRGWMAQHADSL